MPEKSEISIIGFDWRLLPEFSDLLVRLGRHGFRQWPDSVDELRSELEILRADPEQDIVLLTISGDISGYAITVHEHDIDRTVAGLAVASESIKSAGSLLEWILERTRSEGLSRVHTALRNTTVEPVDLLLTQGFSEVTANVELVLSRSDAADLAEQPLSDGYSIRPMRSSVETLLLTRVQNTIFSDHWGFSKNTPEEIQARLDLPITGPDHVLFVESPEGVVAAYVWTALEWEEQRSCGRIWMTGVMPEFRRTGIGRSIVTAGVKHLLAEGAADVRLEVVEHNAGAVRIYEQMGFKPSGRVAWLELKL